MKVVISSGRRPVLRSFNFGENIMPHLSPGDSFTLTDQDGQLLFQLTSQIALVVSLDEDTGVFVIRGHVDKRFPIPAPTGDISTSTTASMDLKRDNRPVRVFRNDI
jgi:hypothetical protein